MRRLHSLKSTRPVYRQAVLGLAVCLAAVWLGICSSAQAGVVLSGGGLVLAEEGGMIDDAANLAAASGGAVAFALDELDFGVHFIPNLNDGLPGNANSWIGGGATGTSGPFAGIDLNGSMSVQSIALGRDNTNAFTDRSLGLYELQFTNVAAPDATTPDGDWMTVGTLDYQSAGGAGFAAPHLRHRYNFSPVTATGLRLIVPGTGVGGGTAIDEIEIYADAGDIVIGPPLPPLTLTPAAGFSITWDGNNGDFFSPDEVAPAPANLASASSGAAPFGSSELDFGVHFIPNVNDGRYGNSNSWISDFTVPDPDPSVGVAFASPVEITSIAWGRDNGNTMTDACGGTCMDRSLGIYEIQFTTVADPNELTAETGDAGTGWQSIAEVEFSFRDAGFDEYLRHEFEVASGGAAILATGLRLKVSDPNIAIDELEVYGTVVPEPASLLLALLGGLAMMGLNGRQR